MLNLLRQHDPKLVEFPAGDGVVVMAPSLQGRIFVHLGGTFIHRLDADMVGNPPATGFNNLGGNYMFPAPEGGPYAFNYLPGNPEWVVQEAINSVNPAVVERDAAHVTVEKDVDLRNRKGIAVRLKVRRTLRPLASASAVNDFDLKAVRYASEDEVIPREHYETRDVLVAPWSLEQFPGGAGVVSFGKVKAPKGCLNFDFYSDPSARASYGPDHFVFPLGDVEKHQVGVTVPSRPEFVGALDSVRSLLLLRRTPRQDGTYFNIADNEQPKGPYSAADQYSVFDGGPLGFFELETIGAMQTDHGAVVPSKLISETMVLNGPMTELQRYLAEREGLHLEQMTVEQE